RRVAIVNSRLTRTDRLSARGVRVAILGKQVQRAGSWCPDSGQFPLATAAIFTAGASQWWLMPGRPAATPAADGCAVIAVAARNPVAAGVRLGQRYPRARARRLQHASARKLLHRRMHDAYAQSLCCA